MFLKKHFIYYALVHVLLSIYSLPSIAKEETFQEIRIESIDAKNIQKDNEGNLVLLENVIITTNLVEFKAEKAIYKESENVLELIDEVRIESTNLKLSTKEITANLKNQTFTAKESSYRFKELTSGNFEEIFIKANGNIELINASLTNCPADDPSWEILTEKIIYLRGKRNAIIKGIKLKIGNIPIFYFPYLRTAIGNERLSGFLSPSIRQGSDGIDLSLPYYFNLAPNYDVVVTTRHITGRGSGASSNLRYLTNNSNGKLILAGLLKDREYEKDTGKKDSRWKVSWAHQGNIKNRFFSKINFKSASDEYFFRDIGDDQFGETRTRYLPKKAEIIWKSKYIEIGLGLKRFQILNPFLQEGYRSQPKLTFNYYSSQGPFSWELESSFTKFTTSIKKDLGQNLEKINRININPDISYKKLLSGSEFSISAGNDFVKYNSNLDSFSSNSPWIESKYSLFFDKNNKDSFKSLIPIVKYVYSRGQGLVNNPLIDSRINSMNYMNLFNRNIYSGLDKISKTNKIILGLEYLFFSSSSSISSSFSFGQAFFLKDQEDFYKIEEEVSKSPFVAELRSNLSKNIKYSSLFEWDHNTNKLNSGSVGLIIKDNKKRFEFRSVYRRKNFHQVYIPWKDDELATYQIESLGTWPISNSWSIFGRWQKDLKTYKSLDILFGFQYENCCLKVGIMNRRWIDEDYFSWKENYEDPIRAILEGFEPSRERDNTYIFLEFKELGRLGKKASRVISSSRLE